MGDATVLQDEIKKNRESTNDATRSSKKTNKHNKQHTPTNTSKNNNIYVCPNNPPIYIYIYSGGSGIQRSANQQAPNQTKANSERSSSENLFHVLVVRQQAHRLRFSGRKAHRLECFHDIQGPRHPAALALGHDLHLLPLGKLCCLRRTW